MKLSTTTSGNFIVDLNFQARGAKMAYMKKILFLLPAIGVLMFSCASLKYVQKEGDVLKLADLVNSKDSKTLAEISASPFLFDAEIIMLPGDLERLWENMADAGLVMENPMVTEIKEVREETPLLFGASMEIKAFFQKYLPETARMARVSADSGNFIFLLDGKEHGYPKIHGVKVY
jgi:hypothetical protein